MKALLIFRNVKLKIGKVFPFLVRVRRPDAVFL